MKWAEVARVSLLGIGFLTNCNDPPKASADSTSKTASAASAGATSPATDPPEKPRRTIMPDLVVDEEGPYLGGLRFGGASGSEKMSAFVRELPIDKKPVVVIAERKAKARDVGLVVTELGAAGAPKITVKTEGRADLPKEIALTPEERVTTAADCSIVAVVSKDFSTAIWPKKGGVGKKQRKGLAGPDFTQTSEVLLKELLACDSSVAFVGVEEPVPWEMAHNLAGTILVSDQKKRLDTIVFLREAPTPGRPLKAH